METEADNPCAEGRSHCLRLLFGAVTASVFADKPGERQAQVRGDASSSQCKYDCRKGPARPPSVELCPAPGKASKTRSQHPPAQDRQHIYPRRSEGTGGCCCEKRLLGWSCKSTLPRRTQLVACQLRGVMSSLWSRMG